MPCHVDADWTPPKNVRANESAEAMLCGIVAVLDREHSLRGVLDYVDWNEAGVTMAEFYAWWEKHKRKDAERRQREQEEMRKKALRQSALGKLSPEERKALRIK